jgi:hypothetical protein
MTDVRQTIHTRVPRPEAWERTTLLRIKAGELQQAWRHTYGDLKWVPVPVED